MYHFDLYITPRGWISRSRYDFTIFRMSKMMNIFTHLNPLYVDLSQKSWLNKGAQIILLHSALNAGFFSISTVLRSSKLVAK